MWGEGRLGRCGEKEDWGGVGRRKTGEVWGEGRLGRCREKEDWGGVVSIYGQGRT